MVAHSQILLSKCAQFREEGEFIDVRLKVDEDVFPAHRIVLAANSDYFHAMFKNGMKESNQEVIELKDESISPDTLKIIIDYIYTGDLHVNEENVSEVLVAADHLQVTSVAKLCCDFLLIGFVQLRFGVQTYSRVWTIADRPGLRDLQEAVENKMASSMYRDICEKEEFLTHISADQLVSLLSRDDLSAPSETFVFKSVMQWIKHKKEERMAAAAKVIGAVRLGLVDIRVVIKELDTEEMQRNSVTNMLVYQALIHNNMPSHNPKFAEEKAKPRSMNPVPVAILPNTQMQYFDVVTKTWKLLPSMGQANEQNQSCFCAEYAGNYLYVAAKNQSNHFVIYRYDTVNNSWGTLPPFRTHKINGLCAVGDYIYAISKTNRTPERYSLSNNNWEKGAKMSCLYEHFTDKELTMVQAAVVLKYKVYAIRGYLFQKDGYVVDTGESCGWVAGPALVHCFDPAKNRWERKASTREPHLGSSLLVVNNRLYVAGGKFSVNTFGRPRDDPAPVEVYNEENNTWSVVEQKRIPPNKLGAVEIEGRMYFIINKFPIDSGIRIPPGEKNYHGSLNEWENLAKVAEGAVLCYLPVKRENLKMEEGESKTD